MPGFGTNCGAMSSMQAIDGVHLGWAKEPMEITLAPVSPRASSSRSFSETGMSGLSICSPSRMVSSVIVTLFGSMDVMVVAQVALKMPPILA